MGRGAWRGTRRVWCDLRMYWSCCGFPARHGTVTKGLGAAEPHGMRRTLVGSWGRMVGMAVAGERGPRVVVWGLGLGSGSWAQGQGPSTGHVVLVMGIQVLAWGSRAQGLTLGSWTRVRVLGRAGQGPSDEDVGPGLGVGVPELGMEFLPWGSVSQLLNPLLFYPDHP